MKILMVNKFYFIKGGSERYYFELSKILKEYGHEIIPFAMKHPDNFKSDYNNCFVDNIEFNLDSNWQKMKNSAKIITRIIYSFHAQKQIKQLIEKTRPDIAHLHMIDHQISPSILNTLKKYNIPVIQTQHQYKLVCPNYRLYNMHKQEICEKCLDGNYYHPIFERCHKNSLSSEVLLSLEMYIHKALQIYEKNIDIFHVPSHFMGSKLKAIGIPNEKIQHLFYTIDLKNYLPQDDSDNYIVYYGRLAREKGILTLLKAMRHVKKTDLLIIGDGPQRKELESFASENQLQNVKFVGLKNGEALKRLVARSKFVLIPSEWYDNSPLVIYESFALGKPVIGSSIGGIPELIDHKSTGLLHEPGNCEELTENINFLLNQPKLIKEYGINAHRKAQEQFSPQNHYQKIIKIYQGLVGMKQDMTADEN